MKNLKIILTLVYCFFMLTCTKKKTAVPQEGTQANADFRTTLTGEYEGTYEGRTVNAGAATYWDNAGSLLVELASDPEQLKIPALSDPLVTIHSSDLTFGNSRCSGQFFKDSVRLTTYLTPAAATYTTYTGKRKH